MSFSVSDLVSYFSRGGVIGILCTVFYFFLQKNGAMVFALSRTGMLRSYIESYEVSALLGEVSRKYLSSYIKLVHSTVTVTFWCSYRVVTGRVPALARSHMNGSLPSREQQNKQQKQCPCPLVPKTITSATLEDQ